MKSNRLKTASCICFILLMLIDKVVGTASQYVWLITNNFVGIAFSVLMFYSFGIKSFAKPFYVVWSIVGIAGMIAGNMFWYTHQVGHIMAFWITVPLNIWILGMLFFKYIERIFISKDLKIRFQKWEVAFAICLILMLLSRNESVWPLYYLIIFLMLWYCPISSEDKKQVFLGAIDGIITGFILLQCYGFVATRYITPRYRGAYGDCNRNACMYLMVLSALLIKDVIIRKQTESIDKRKGFKSIAWLILSGIVCALILYTGCRSALFGAFCIIITYVLLGRRHILKEKYGKIIKTVALLLTIVFLALPILYLPIRYLPESSRYIFSILAGEKEDFVETNSSYDYVTFDESMNSVLFRVFRSDVNGSSSSNRIIHSHKTKLRSSDPGTDEYYTINYTFSDYPEKGTFSFRVPSYLYSRFRSLNHRINIYLVLLRNLNLTGHTTSEMFIDIESDVPGAELVYLYNAQNFVIYLLYAYGILIGLFICSLMIAELVFIIRKVKQGNIDGLFFLMIAMAYICMGLMEVVWIPGQLILVLLFVAPFFGGDTLGEERNITR